MLRIRGRKWISSVRHGGLISGLSSPAARLWKWARGSPPGEKCSLSEQRSATDCRPLPNANKQSGRAPERPRSFPHCGAFCRLGGFVWKADCSVCNFWAQTCQGLKERDLLSITSCCSGKLTAVRTFDPWDCCVVLKLDGTAAADGLFTGSGCPPGVKKVLKSDFFKHFLRVVNMYISPSRFYSNICEFFFL